MKNRLSIRKTVQLLGLAKHREPRAIRWMSVFPVALLLSCAMACRSKAAENWMLSTPEPLPSPINLTNTFSISPWLTADGLTLYFASDRPGGYGKLDLWVATRNSTSENWGDPVNLGPAVNTAASEAMPCLSSDELTLYFSDANPFGWTPRTGVSGNFQLWSTTRATWQSSWGIPTDLGAPVGTTYAESYPHVSRDGLSFYFSSTRPGLGLYVAYRTAPNDPWLAPTNLGSVLNQGSWSGGPCLSYDGLRLLYYTDRAGGRGGFDLWMSTRSTVTNTWPAPVNLGAQVNGAFYDTSPCVSADFPAMGSTLLFSRNDANAWNTRFKIYRAVVIPNVSLLRAPSLDGPWNPANASFVPLSNDTILAEGPADPQSPQLFYRMRMNGGTGSARIHSAEKSGSTFRVRFQWTP